jgi:hypothetical protein
MASGQVSRIPPRFAMRADDVRHGKSASRVARAPATAADVQGAPP